MKTDKGDTSLVIAQFVLLLGTVAFVDHALIRTGLGFVIGLLLLQRALGLVAPKSEAAEFQDRRSDQLTRGAVSQLLAKIREFYTACHLVQSEQISPAEAKERTTKIERDLNRLLAEVVRASRGEAVPVEGEVPTS